MSKLFQERNVPRPAVVKDKHLEYLDALRESGITNMYGARPYLQNAFKRLKSDEAGEILVYWMRSFAERHGHLEREAK